MKQHTEYDPQLAELLRESFPERPQDEVEQLTRRVMRRLPRRRRRTVLALLLAYIQSPLWLVTAAVLCVLLCTLSTADLPARLANPQALIPLALLLALATAAVFLDMLWEVEKKTI